MQHSKDFQNVLMSILSFLLLLTGRFLTNIFLVFQIIAVRCAFESQEICQFQTDQIRFYLNILGMVFSIGITYFQYVYLFTMFPQDHIPWASPLNKYRILKRLVLLVSVIILSFIDFWTKIIAFYVVLIPLFILQTIQIWILVFSRVSFDPIIELADILYDCLFWTLLFYGITIEISQEVTDTSYCIIAIFSSIICTVLIYLYKRQMNEHFLKKSNTQQKNEHA